MLPNVRLSSMNSVFCANTVDRADFKEKFRAYQVGTCALRLQITALTACSSLETSVIQATSILLPRNVCHSESTWRDYYPALLI